MVVVKFLALFLYSIGWIIGFLLRPMANGWFQGFYYYNLKESARQKQLANEHVEKREKDLEDKLTNH